MAFQMTLAAAVTDYSYDLVHEAANCNGQNITARPKNSAWHWFAGRNRIFSLAHLPDHTLADIGVHRSNISPAPCTPATPIRRSSVNSD
ncbi:MAG: DUF1127 domain-containing protein [Alphaproteobacteria bacterium]|jgi:uncharacterized protein YjiS (DUF1127 family)|nr:DUF1127 domain-containing protein [Alphaproteobacteria bacterium]MDP6830971.1 DUF1127 domain-containing protein [Alphaproteobacteria bacterium]MDP6874070.1 DUF1127 domain-containing protein [Alphaproteobacteria bacterium]